MLQRFAFLFVACAVVTSCQKASLSFIDHQVTLEGGSVKEFVVDAPKADQSVHVQLKGQGDVEAYLVLGQPRKIVELLQNGRTPQADSYLAMTKVNGSGELTGKISAGKEFAVVISNPGGSSKHYTISIRGTPAK